MSLQKKRIPEYLENAIYKSFKSLFKHTIGYQRWRARREEQIDAEHLDARVQRRRQALRSARHPDWSGFEVLSLTSLQQGLFCTLHPTGKRFVLAFGHQDYTKVLGGIQLCIGIEEAAFGAGGDDYVYLFPARPSALSLDASFAEIQLLGIVCNGHKLGYSVASDITRALANLTTQTNRSVLLVLHSLSGHCIEFVIRLTEYLAIQKVFFWLHDFHTCCLSAHLLFNDHSFCDAPLPTSNMCKTCLYGEFRHAHLQRFEKLFNAYPVTLIAPSQFALDYWRSRSSLPVQSTLVQGHIKAIRSDLRTKVSRAPLRVGFLGVTAFHKGWSTFVRLAEAMKGDQRYVFHAFTQSDVFNQHIRGCKVEVSQGDPKAMIEALKDRNIDIVVLWSRCPETFSFTMYEAMAADAFIITTTSSGNIAHTVQDHDHGVILSTEEELLEAFRGGEIVSLYNAFCEARPSLILTRNSQITAEVLADPEPL